MVTLKTKLKMIKEAVKGSLEEKTKNFDTEKIKETGNEALSTAKSAFNLGKEKVEEIYNGVAVQTAKGTVEGFLKGAKNRVEKIYTSNMRTLEKKAESGDENAIKILAVKDKIEDRASKGFNFIKGKYADLVHPESEILPEYKKIISLVNNELGVSGNKTYENRINDNTTVNFSKELLKKNVIFSSGRDDYNISVKVDTHSENSHITYDILLNNSKNNDLETIMKGISKNIKEVVMEEVDMNKFKKYSSTLEAAFDNGKGGFAEYEVDIMLKDNSLELKYNPKGKEKGLVLNYNITIGGQ